jgi:hypothetical protein
VLIRGELYGISEELKHDPFTRGTFQDAFSGEKEMKNERYLPDQWSLS